MRVYCDDVLLATVLLSDEGSIDGQPFKGSGYRRAVIQDAEGNVVQTTDGYECLIPSEGDCGVLERANAFQLDYVELQQFAYALTVDGYGLLNTSES